MCLNTLYKPAVVALYALLALIEFRTSVNAQNVPEENRAAVHAVFDAYEAQCQRDLNSDINLSPTKSSLYQIRIDEEETTATVLYTDFSCGDLGPIWCGSGGCNVYLFVDGKTFEWRVTFPPYALQIPNPYTSSLRSSVIFPLHGMYCKGSNGEHASGMFGCYEIALWDKQQKTFMTRTGTLAKHLP